MSPLSFSRSVVRTLSLTAILVLLVSISLVWTSRQQAGSPSFKSPGHHAAQAVFADKGVITPAATITVNTLSDSFDPNDGKCTLREAVNAANNNAASGPVAGECAAGSSSGADTITFSVVGTINISTSSLPTITSDMTITGPGSSQLTIRRKDGNPYRIVNIDRGIVGLSGLTITNGFASNGNTFFYGGGIRNLGALTMTDVTVTANETEGGSSGAGISNQGDLTMTNCSVTGNSTGPKFASDVTNDGGGIINLGTLIMTDCVVSGNRAGSAAASGLAAGSGGGIYSTGPMTLIRTTISNNNSGNSNHTSSSAGNGAGIYQSGVAAASLIDCTVSGNTAGSGPGSGGWGGGIFEENGATIGIDNSTLSGNSSNAGGGIYNRGTQRITNSTLTNNTSTSLGGGIFNESGFIDINNSTIARNTTANRGGGVFNATVVRIRNTIIALNNGSIGPDFNTQITSLGHNLIGIDGGMTPAAGDQIGTTGSPIDPLLGPLQNNGGLTQTLALLAGSPASDAGDNCVTEAAHCGDGNVNQLTNDQRGAGFSRIADGPDGDTVATVDIGAVEGAVAFANIPDQVINEDSQLQFAFSATDPGSITSASASSDKPALVPNDSGHLSISIVGSSGLVTIQPTANLPGTANITLTLNRTGGPENKTFLLTVNAVNDAPSFTKGADQTVNEDAGAQTVNNWATSISPGPSDEAGQTVSFNVTGNTNAGLFSSAPAVSSTGTLTYTPAPNANGSATITINSKDDGGTANGGVDTSASQTFTITVTAVNDAPTFTKGANQTANEDSGLHAISGWATNISAGPNETGQTVSFTVTNDNGSLFGLQGEPAVTSNGVLTYTLAPDAFGSTTVSVTLKDNGGTANGGSDTSAVQTFTITVNAVNDAPGFNKGANQTVNEDSGAQTVNNWATGIIAGPANESSQTLTFQVTGNTNAALFSTAPAISSNGTLTFTPAANANGSATITFNLKDDGGTANGGVDTSTSLTFTITVNAVNDAPSFTKGADQTVSNQAGPQSVTNWATSISRGPSNESSQTLTFQVTNNTNPSLFSAQPAVSSAGTLTYTPSASAGGTATITINLKDNGGTANGGVDTSGSQTFNITVTPAGGFVSFASSTGNTTENSGSTTVNVVRTGDTTMPVTVQYATNADAGVPCSTANGVASPKCDFTASLGTLSFAIGETSKPVTILISQDSFVEGPETITLTLSSPTGGAALGTPGTMSVTIADDATEPATNIIDDPNQFVRLHYHDFLNREADQSGLDFWTGQMTNCGNSDLTVCRVNVSGAFFLSIEFQQTGYLVERMYKTGYGDAVGISQIGGSHQIFVPVVRANEFLADTQRVGRGVIVNQGDWQTALENNKQAYALEFVQTSRFITAFPTSMTPAQFVDKLNTNAGGVLSVSERQAVINLFGNSVNTTNVTARAQALRQVADDTDLQSAEFNRAFVLTQYIGYLRRNPNDAPDSDYTGYDFWLGKLNQFNGNFVAAEMVKAFISSPEYRQRFGP